MGRSLTIGSWDESNQVTPVPLHFVLIAYYPWYEIEMYKLESSFIELKDNFMCTRCVLQLHLARGKAPCEG